MYLAAIMGGIFGLSVAWGIDYYYRMKDAEEEQESQERLKADIEQIRKGYQKTR